MLTWKIVGASKVFFVLLDFMCYRVFKKKIRIFGFFFFLNNADVENCGSFKSFGFICIYRLLLLLLLLLF